MDQNKPELTFDESVNQVMQTLPLVIRTYLVQGKHTTVARSLMMKYGLRIDQAGVLEQEIILLIMGIDNPTEFTQALIEEAKLDQQTVNSIVQDVNTQIFVPLREEMRKGPQQTAAPTSSASPRTTQGTARPMTVPPRPTAQMAGNEPFAPRSGAPGQRSDLRSVLASVTKEVPHASPGATQGTAKLLEDHEEPHINIGVRYKVQGASPPANLPGVIHHPPIIPPPVPPPPPAKPYSSDPYREPVEP